MGEGTGVVTQVPNDDLLVEIDPVEIAKVQPRPADNQWVPTRGE